MAPAPPNSSIQADLRTLHKQIDETTALIRLLSDGLAATTKPSQPAQPNQPPQPSSSSQSPQASSQPPKSAPPLPVLATASTLLRSQTTHLSLLSLTPPFTPTALVSTLRTFTKILPAFAAASEDLRSDRSHPEALGVEIKQRVGQLYKAVSALVKQVPRSAGVQKEFEEVEEVDVNGDGASDEDGGDGDRDRDARIDIIDTSPSTQPQSRPKGGGRERKRVLRGTGVVWAGCAWFEELQKKGIERWARSRIRSWKALEEDALGEIEEWIGEEDVEGVTARLDQTRLDRTNGNEDDEKDSDSDSEDDDTCPPTMRPLANKTLKQLRHVRGVYGLLLARVSQASQAVQSEAADPTGQARILEARLALARSVSDATDEVAAALYDGDEDTVDDEVTKLRSTVTNSIESCSVDREALARWEEQFKALLLV